MNLIIVESPTKVRTLTRFLGNGYHVSSTMGHLRDLPKSVLGIDVEHDFAPLYQEVVKREDVIKGLQKEAKKAQKIFLATDPDREGEAIAWHVAHILGRSKASRISFHEITKDAIQESLAHPGKINMQLVNAQQARRVLDRLVGYKLSPLLWKKVRIGLSAGRVQSVTVRLIVEREREIEAFKAQEYWEIFCNVKTKNEKLKIKEFLIKLIKIGEKTAEVKNKEQATKIVKDLEKASYKVASVSRREVHKRPAPPFTTSTMTQAAARHFFWPARKTMITAQRLYEKGLITYHRTDSLNLNIAAVNKARELIKESFGENYLPPSPRFYKTKSKLAQEAHEAIRPTDVRRVSGPQYPVSNKFGGDASKLYSLIWKRFVACQMADEVLDETRIDVEAALSRVESYILRATGSIVKFDGWRKVWGKRTEDGEVILPEVKENEPLQLIKVLPEQKFTEPPPRYTEASLIKILEKLGIGRPSTYAPTISTIQARQYVEKQEGKFFATTIGIAVNDFLVTNFPDTIDYQFTAQMEGDLDNIANGEKKWVPVIREFWNPFSKKLKTVEKNSKRVKIEVEKTGKKCPKCKTGDQVIRVGRFGKFFSCSLFPKCDYTETYMEKTGVKCSNCQQGDVVVRRSKKGRRFFGCSRFPTCTWASWTNPSAKKETKS